MTRCSDVFKKCLKKNKTCFILGVVFVFLLIFGIQVGYAFYNKSDAISILSNKVGDFDIGDGDINALIYKENDDGKFVRNHSIPAAGYKYDANLTTCTIPCDTNTSSSCHYSYNQTTGIELVSKEKVTCKFYFKKVADSDITVYILKEDANGTHAYNSKKYTIMDGVPAFGYTYSSYKCDNAATLTYNSETKKFKIETSGKNTCYAYFNSTGNADIIAKVYIQSAKGSTVYNETNIIPANNTYKLSTSKTSRCYNSAGTTLSTPVSYTNGYIVIDASEKQTCDVYLDIQ